MTTLAKFALLAAIAAAFASGISYGKAAHHRPCTHGVSSIGPITITNGHVAGDTTPHTEECLP